MLEAHIENVDGRVNVILVILDGLLSALANSFVRCDVDDAPNATLILVGFKDLVNVLGIGDIALEDFNLGGILVVLRRVRS